MASYEDTVLALLPVAYWRLDETLGPVMTDSSGNAHHGTYYPGANFGLASPIETDPASLAVGGAVGEASALDSSPLDASLGSTVGGWLYWREDYNGDTATVLSRTASWGTLGGFLGVGQSIIAVPNRWYFLLGTRNGNVMRLYVNGELNDQRTDLGGVTEYPRHIIGFNNGQPDYRLATRHISDQPWIVGIDGSIFYGNVDEPFVIDYAINATQARTVYEAALLRLLSSATIQVRVQVLLDTDAPEPIDFAFAHNWTEPISGSERVITEHLSWRTYGNRSEPDYEQRINARPHGPRRALEYAITPTSALAKARLQRALWQPAQVFKLPILLSLIHI